MKNFWAGNNPDIVKEARVMKEWHRRGKEQLERVRAIAKIKGCSPKYAQHWGERENKDE